MSKAIKRTAVKSKDEGSSNRDSESDDDVVEATTAEPTATSWLPIVFPVMAGALALIWLLMAGGSDEDDMIVFSSATQTNKQLVYKVRCSDDYKNDPFPDCVPTHCARVVMDELVTEEEASALLSLAKKGLAYGGSNGGASILDLHSGALSQGDKFINIFSILSGEEFEAKDFQLYRSVKDKIHGAIASYFHVPASKLYLTKPTFFSRMNTTEAKTVHDQYWHPHVDKVTYGSFHYTSLLYLTTYGTDFTGGRFVFVDKDGNRTVEPRLGRVSFFTSGSENLHFVEQLQSGTRYAITISFTCDPNMAIADPQSQ